MRATDSEAFRRADEAVRAAFAPKERYRWRLAFRTRAYAPACEAVAAVERMNAGLFDGEPPPIGDLVYTVSQDGPYLFHELLFVADDAAANAARLAAMGSAIAGSGHLTRAGKAI